MKQTIAICAGVLALGLAGAQPATAQLVYPGYRVYPAYPGFAVIAPPEVVAIVRSNGMKPLTPPMRRGPVYLLHALDPNGQEVRVVVNARSGRVIAVRPTFGPRYAAVPPPYGRPPSGVPLAEGGYGPNSRVAALPPDVDGPPGAGPGGYGPGPGPAYGPGPGPARGPGPGPGYEPGPGPGHGPGAGPAYGPGYAPGAAPGYGPPPVGRAPAAQAPGPSVQAGPPPLPRPRPKVASADSSAAAPAAAKPATAALPPARSLSAAPELKDQITTGTVAAPTAAPPPVAYEMHE